jgi:hypothetical protein
MPDRLQVIPTSTAYAVNLNLPISLSFIGCVFETGLIAVNAEFVSLDLSGSSFQFLHAHGLKTSGSLFMRRATVLSPIGLSGCHIGARLDASDLLAFPGKPRSSAQLIDNDHGILNLTQATVENELRLDRARLWGGLSVRGATVNRNVHLAGALVASPISVLEKWAFDLVGEAANEEAANEEAVQSLGSVDRVLAKHVLHSGEWPAATFSRPNDGPSEGGWSVRKGSMSEAQMTALCELETLAGISSWDHQTLGEMLGESIRARANAIRADALTLHGNLEAEHLYTSGRFRMKYAKIDGVLRLSGATLNSSEASRSSLSKILPGREENLRGELLKLNNLRNATGTPFHGGAEDEFYYPQDYALDIRNSLLSDLEFTHGELIEPALRSSKGRIYHKDVKISSYARVDGRLAMDGVKIEGSISARKVLFFWKPLGVRGVDLEKPMMRNDVYLQICAQLSTDSPKSNCSETEGRNASDLKRARARATSMDNYEVESLGGHVISLSQAIIGDDADFRASRGIWGADFHEAHIAGSIRFSNKSGSRLDGGKTGQIECRNRVHDLWGEVNLRGTRVEGDVFLVFDPDRGPNIKADFAKIGGRLDIYPARTSTRAAPKKKAQTLSSESFWWSKCDHEPMDSSSSECANCTLTLPRRALLPKYGAKSTLNHFGTQRDSNGLPAEGGKPIDWFIELRNMRATVFAHPPAAWPHPEALRLDGFRYERSSYLGPLPPIGIQSETGYEENSLRQQSIKSVILKSVGLTTIFGLILLGLIFYFLSDAIGFDTSRIGSGVSLWASLSLAWLIWEWSTKKSNREALVGPMALDYLDRQRTEPNWFHSKAYPSRYVTLEPYMTAARALREAGKLISADEVNLRRLRRQAQMLSLRTNSALKAGMLLVDWLAGYGYRLDRWLRRAILSIVVVAVPVDLSSLLSDRRLPSGLLFSLDRIVPGLDIFSPKEPNLTLAPSILDGIHHTFLREGLLSFTDLTPFLLQLWGLALTAAFTFAIAARVETTLALRRS